MVTFHAYVIDRAGTLVCHTIKARTELAMRDRMAAAYPNTGILAIGEQTDGYGLKMSGADKAALESARRRRK